MTNLLRDVGRDCVASPSTRGVSLGAAFDPSLPKSLAQLLRNNFRNRSRCVTQLTLGIKNSSINTLAFGGFSEIALASTFVNYAQLTLCLRLPDSEGRSKRRAETAQRIPPPLNVLRGAHLFGISPPLAGRLRLGAAGCPSGGIEATRDTSAERRVRPVRRVRASLTLPCSRQDCPGNRNRL